MDIIAFQSFSENKNQVQHIHGGGAPLLWWNRNTFNKKLIIKYPITPLLFCSIPMVLHVVQDVPKKLPLEISYFVVKKCIVILWEFNWIVWKCMFNNKELIQQRVLYKRSQLQHD
jgi:hypothetical protein